MVKKFQLFIFILCSNICLGQIHNCPKDSIIYEVPENIKHRLDSAAKNLSDNFSKKYIFFEINNTTNNGFDIELFCSNFMDKMELDLYQKTNRYLHIHNYYFPVVFGADYEFSTIIVQRNKDGSISTMTKIGAPYYISFRLIGKVNAIITDEGIIQ